MGVPEASAGQLRQDTRKCDCCTGGCSWCLRNCIGRAVGVNGRSAWAGAGLCPGSSELAVCQHELRSRPVILRNAWSEPKENEVGPGETLCHVRADTTGTR